MFCFKAIKGLLLLQQLNHIMARGLAMIKTPLFIVVRGFASAFYWSSTENNANNAWNQNFSGGGQNNDNKNNNQRVRCVRGFKQNKKTKQERIAQVLKLPSSFFYTVDDDLAELLKLYGHLTKKEQQQLVHFAKQLSK